MTSATKRKHVVKEMLDDFSIPEQHQRIVKVLGTQGSNLHEVVTQENEKILCSLPVKFRKNIWIKRGDFVVIESIEEGDKVKAEIVRILYPQHVKFLQKEGHWPKDFCPRSNEYKGEEDLPNKLEKIDLEEKQIKPNHKENYILNLNNGAGDMPSDEDEYYSSEDDLLDIPANTNRPTVAFEDSSDYDTDESTSG